MNKIFKIWSEEPKPLREDLKLASYAGSLGFTVHCTPKNEKDIPCSPIQFSKGKTRIWRAVYNNDLYWRCADIIENLYRNHRSYSDLKTALDTERGE